MEGINPRNDKEIEQENEPFKQHKSFFGWENIKRLLGNTLMAGGSVLVLSGIYERYTGQSVEQLFNEYKDQLPDIINWTIRHIDLRDENLQVGSSLITTGLALRGILKNLVSNDEKIK